MGQSVVNEFRSDLRFSQAASDEPFWDEIYRKAFPDMAAHMVIDTNSQAQRLGIDRVITLNSGKTLYVDEKKRRQSWGDILLEYISADTTGAPGWIEKPLQIDYLAYAFMDVRRAYLFPWQMLRRVWLHYKDVWLGSYKIVPAQNRNYTTYSVAVPINELLAAVKNAGIIQL